MAAGPEKSAPLPESEESVEILLRPESGRQNFYLFCHPYLVFAMISLFIPKSEDSGDVPAPTSSRSLQMR